MEIIKEKPVDYYITLDSQELLLESKVPLALHAWLLEKMKEIPQTDPSYFSFTMTLIKHFYFPTFNYSEAERLLMILKHAN